MVSPKFVRTIQLGDTMKKLLFVLLAVIALFSGCDFLEYDNITEEKLESIFEYEFNENVKFYGDELSVHVSLINDTTLLVGTSMPSEHVPQVGDVILCPSTANTPRGFLRRAESIDNSTDGLIVSTIPATLADAFYTLKFEQTFDYADCAKEFRDSLGNEIPFEVLAGSVMEQLDSTKTNTQTKISGEANLTPKSLKFDISNRFFSGSAYLESQIYVKFDIGFGKVDVTYEIDKKVGLKGTAFISSAQLGGTDYEDDLTLTLLDKSIPVGTPIGPLWMQFFPSLNFGISFIGNGDMSLEGKVNYVLEDTKSRYSYKNGVEHKEVINNLNSNSSWMKMVSLEAEGELGLQGSVGMEFRLWNGDMLAFGGEASLLYGLTAEAGISMSNESLLISNPKLTVGPKLSASLYVESYFINNRKHRIEATVEKSFESFDINILPEFKQTKEKTKTKLTVKPTVKPISMIEISEQGFDLFCTESPNAPILHKSLPSSTIVDDVPTAKYVDVQLELSEVTFTLPEPNKNYEVRSYVVANDRHYYGPSKRLKKIINSDGEILFEVHYSDSGNPDRVSAYNDGWWDVEYTDNLIRIWYSHKEPNYEEYYLDNAGYMYKSRHSYMRNGELHHYETIYTYENGFLSGFGDSCFLWNNGDIISDTSSGGSVQYTYTDIAFNSAINWLFLLGLDGTYDFFLSFPGTYPSHLPAQAKGWYGSYNERHEWTLEFTYTVDDDGYVTSVSGGEDDELMYLYYE